MVETMHLICIMHDISLIMHHITTAMVLQILSPESALITRPVLN